MESIQRIGERPTPASADAPPRRKKGDAPAREDALEALLPGDGCHRQHAAVQ